MSKSRQHVIESLSAKCQTPQERKLLRALAIQFPEVHRGTLVSERFGTLVTQHEVQWHRGSSYYLDLAILGAKGGRKLAIEVDGRQHGDARQLLADEERSAQLHKHGWTVLRFSNVEVDADPVACAARVTREFLGEALPKGHHPIYGSMRAHQRAMLKRVESVIESLGRGGQIDVLACPGAGKSLMVCTAADTMLRAHYVEQVVVVVPWLPLQEQMRGSFHDLSRWLDVDMMVGDNKRLMRDERQPCMFSDRPGYITTYAAIASEPELHARLIGSRPTLLAVDEIHHLAMTCPSLVDVDDDDAETYEEKRRAALESQEWYRHFLPSWQAAKFRIHMTGSRERHDGLRIPFLRYGEDRALSPDIVYTRENGTAEGAVVPVDFHMVDFEVEWKDGKTFHSTWTSKATEAEVRGARRAALDRADVRRHLIERMLDDWNHDRDRIRREHGIENELQALIVCPTRKFARDDYEWMLRQLQVPGGLLEGVSIGLSVTDVGMIDESVRPEAEPVEAFRAGHVRVLVAVGKAYEGLDARPASHLALMSYTASMPRYEQTFGRVWRACAYRNHVKKKRAVVFMLDDRISREAQEYVRIESDGVYRETNYLPKPVLPGAPPPPARTRRFMSISATPVGEHFSDTEEGDLSQEEEQFLARMREVLAREGQLQVLAGIRKRDQLRLLQELQRVQPETGR